MGSMDKATYTKIENLLFRMSVCLYVALLGESVHDNYWDYFPDITVEVRRGFMISNPPIIRPLCF